MSCSFPSFLLFLGHRCFFFFLLAGKPHPDHQGESTQVNNNRNDHIGDVFIVCGKAGQILADDIQHCHEDTGEDHGDGIVDSQQRGKGIGRQMIELAKKYDDEKSYSFVNGVLNEDQDAAAGEWMAWRGKPVEVVIDMNGESYSTLSVRTFVSKWEDMYAPLGLEAYVSDDGQNFEPLAAEEYPIEEETVPDGIKKYDLEFPETSARYLKVVVRTVPALPQWSERTGKPAYLFLDEIKVE